MSPRVLNTFGKTLMMEVISLAASLVSSGLVVFSMGLSDVAFDGFGGKVLEGVVI